MAAADVEQSVDSAVETVLNKPDGMFSLKQEQTSAPKAFVKKKDVTDVYSSLSAALTVWGR